MSGNKIMEQVGAIFSIFMVMFYLGIGVYFAFYFDNTYIDKPVRVILGVSFIIYGAYRAFRTFVKLKELFFREKGDDD